MATRVPLRTRILSDLERSESEWGSSVTDAINDAIDFYQPKRFYFNERRTLTFATVASVDTYAFNTPGVTGAIGAEFYKIDQVLLQIGTTWDILRKDAYDWQEQSADNNIAAGQPYSWAYIDRAIRLYPMPSDVWTVRIIGHQKIEAPADDAEDGNPWVNEAFELIRSRAKGQLAMHVLEDEALATRMTTMERSALTNLKAATYRKTEYGMIIPTQF